MKMILPAVFARMKQSNEFMLVTAFRICRRDIGPLFQVTAQATEAKIALVISSAMLLGDNVIDLVR